VHGRAGNKSAERLCFTLDHVGEVHEVTAGDDFHRARSGVFRLAVLDEVMVIPCDPATDRFGLAGRLERAVRTIGTRCAFSHR
jgi:hypothetical protein